MAAHHLETLKFLIFHVKLDMGMRLQQRRPLALRSSVFLQLNST